MRLRTSALFFLLLLGAAPHHKAGPNATFRILIAGGPYFSESRIPINVAGITGRYSISVLGPGKIENNNFVAPRVTKPAWSLLVGAASGGGIASAWVRIVPPPPASRAILGVAAYRSGITLHDARTFATLGTFAIGGMPTDLAFGSNGSLVTADTDGEILTKISRATWTVQRIPGILEGNEVAIDPETDAVFVTDRDVNGKGALTRVSADGAVQRIITGETAEGLALDPARNVAYVGNVNDDSIAVLDMRSMRILKSFTSVQRPFGIALDSAGQTLFVVSNTSTSMSAHGGYVAAFSLRGTPHMIARSPKMTFPLGIAYDRNRRRIFATDEAANDIYVLDAQTLRTAHAPLVTCATPWRPSIAGDRLFVPCARNNRFDVFSLATLQRISGAPFPTGAYPLSVALWQPPAGRQQQRSK